MIARRARRARLYRCQDYLACALALLIIAPGLAQKTDRLKPAYNAEPLIMLRWSEEQLRRWEIIPPDEFDHEYAGPMALTRVDEAGLKANCPSTTKDGCAYSFGTQTCLVYIVNDDILERHGYSYDLVCRHERAHCNGWRHTKK